MASYEIEIKCLLGEEDRARELVSRMKDLDDGLALENQEAQKNHYFVAGRLADLAAKLEPALRPGETEEIRRLEEKTVDYSVRSRENRQGVLLVIKAAVDDTTSANGTARRELEIPVDLPLQELDDLILSAGFSYQAKWSRERSLYRFRDAAVSIDKNAGYGYLAEFEKIIEDETKAEETKENLRRMIQELELAELDQERLGRMFQYYNEHWPEYYGTDKIFIVE
jgi:predicted adenylyl cyclase CyaB